jgi:hypothetical protein
LRENQEPNVKIGSLGHVDKLLPIIIDGIYGFCKFQNFKKFNEKKLW